MGRVRINQLAPEIALDDYTGEPFVLSELKEKKNAVLVFNLGFV